MCLLWRRYASAEIDGDDDGNEKKSEKKVKFLFCGAIDMSTDNLLGHDV